MYSQNKIFDPLALFSLLIPHLQNNPQESGEEYH